MKKREFAAALALLGVVSALCIRLMQAAGERLARQQGEARDRMEAARRAGDEAGAERLFHEYAYLSNQVGLHEGPVANSQAALDEALAKAGVSSMEEARAMLLEPAQEADLRAQIRDYQDDYARTLAACQSLS